MESIGLISIIVTVIVWVTLFSKLNKILRILQQQQRGDMREKSVAGDYSQYSDDDLYQMWNDGTLSKDEYKKAKASKK